MDQAPEVERAPITERAHGIERASEAGQKQEEPEAEAQRTAESHEAKTRSRLQPSKQARPANGGDAADDMPDPEEARDTGLAADAATGPETSPQTDPETGPNTVILMRLPSGPPEAPNGSAPAEADAASGPGTGDETIMLPKLPGMRPEAQNGSALAEAGAPDTKPKHDTARSSPSGMAHALWRDVPSDTEAPAEAESVAALQRESAGEPFQRYIPTRRSKMVSRATLLGILCLQAIMSLRLPNTTFLHEGVYLHSWHLELEHVLHGASLRALNLVGMLATTALLYSIVRRLFTERAGLCAAALFSVTQTLLFQGNFATLNPTCVFLLAAAAWIMVYTARCRWPLFFLAVPVAALAVTVNYAGVLWIPAIAVLPPLAAWPYRTRRAWWYSICFLVAVSEILYALRLGGNVYVTVVKSTLTNPGKGALQVAALRADRLTWAGLVFALAVIGSVAYVHRVRTEPDELISPVGSRLRRAVLRLALTGTALLALAYEAYLHTDMSYRDYIGFGLCFAAPVAGLLMPRRFSAPLSQRSRDAIDRHRSLIAALAAIAVIATTATLTSVRLDASPQPTGAPPLDMPSPGRSQLAQLPSGTWPTTQPDSVPATCKQVSVKGSAGASVISYLDDNSSEQDLVAAEAKGLNLIDFSWTSLVSPTDLVQTDSFDPSLATELTAADQSGPCGLRFVTLSDNDPSMSHSADVRMMTEILTNPSIRQQHVLTVANWMAGLPLAAGLTIDYEDGLPQNVSDLKTAEKVAGWSGLSLDEAVNRLSGDYTELIREIAAAVHQQHRLVRLMAPVRDSDDVDAASTDIAPYLLDYGALAQYVDQIVLEAYDFHYATGSPGPIAPFADVAQVLTYVHSYGVPWSKLAVVAPLYAYDWTVNNSGGVAVNVNGQPISATTLTATQVAADKKRWHLEETEDGETEYSYTQAGKKHVVWDASSALKTEIAWLKRNYPQIGIDASEIGDADPAGSALAVRLLG